jgi:hypothetical protein
MGRNKTNIKERIYEAYIELLEDNDGDGDNISITDICDRAYASRVSYYRTFNSKSDIIVGHLEDYMNSYHKKHSIPANSDIKVILYHILNVSYENQRLIRLLMKKHVIREEIYLDKKFQDNLGKKITSTNENTNYYKLIFYLGAIAAVSNKWVLNGCKEPLEEILNILLENIRPI